MGLRVELSVPNRPLATTPSSAQEPPVQRHPPDSQSTLSQSVEGLKDL